jgi:hypothetical protein
MNAHNPGCFNLRLSVIIGGLIIAGCFSAA